MNGEPTASGPDLDGYRFHVLHQEGALAWLRGWRGGDATILLAQPASEAVAAQALQQMQSEYALREQLPPAWALAPTALVRRQGGPALVYPDDQAETLDQRQARAVDIDTFLAVAIGASGALAALHGAGLAHRSLRPTSIRIDAAGRCRLAGFGMAGPVHGAADGAALCGTPAYMSPEHSGRTGRSPDARSDLYSLGVIFHELLAGRLPFEPEAEAGAAPGSWIHAHLASPPPPLDQVRPGLPEVLARIVARLLEKSPEQRYQSAAGLERDLRRCRLAWHSRGMLAPFPLGQQDRAGALAFPARLYGREAQAAAARAALDEVCASGRQALLLVSGASGVGKSALLQGLLAAPRTQRLAAGWAKADQYRHDIPYAVLADALRSVVLRILGEGGAAYWRERLRAGLAGSAALACELVPELASLLGGACAAASGPESQDRFRHAVLALVRAFAAPAHPLLLMLDDAQWLDAATTEVLAALLSSSQAVPMLLAVSCRHGGEAGPGAPLLLEPLRAAAPRLREVALAPLGQTVLARMLADTFGSGRRQAGALAEVVHGKTAGNPYFVRQFIQAVADDGLIARDVRDGRWRFDLQAMRARGYTANVVDLVLVRLGRLPSETQHVLAALACLGQGGDATLLGELLELPGQQIHLRLLPALAAEAVQRSGDGYRFSHDRVQEAVHATTQAALQQQLHLGLARLQARRATASNRDELVFRAADHLAQAGLQPLAQEERRRFAQLALDAARRARRSCAYESALRYLGLSRGLLEQMVGERPVEAAVRRLEWTGAQQPMEAALEDAARSVLRVELALEQASCEFLSGHLERSLGVLLPLLADAAALPLPVRAQAWRLRLEIHMRRSEFSAAVALALAALATFGIHIPAHPDDQACDLAYAGIRPLLRGDCAATLLALPPLRDDEAQAAMGLLWALSFPATMTDPRLQFIQLCHLLRLTFERGMSPSAPVALAWLGVLAAERYGAYAEGYGYALAARALAERQDHRGYLAQVLLPMDQVGVWTQPLAWTVDCAREGYALALAAGDTTTASYECCHIVCNCMVLGVPLEALGAEIARLLPFVREADFADVETILLLQQEFVNGLRSTDGALGGAALRGWTPGYALGGRMPPMEFWRWLYIAITHYLAGELADARDALERAGGLAWAAPAHIHQLDYHLYSVLVLGALARQAPGPGAESRAVLEGHAARIGQWADLHPDTFADKHAVARAVLLGLDGRGREALAACEHAIAHAEARGYEQYAGLAWELAATLAQDSGLAAAARAYTRGARDAYRRWGAAAKAAHIERTLPQLMAAPPRASDGTVSFTDTAAIRDIDSVIRAARALSEEIVLDDLVRTLMKIVLQQAGAQRGLLLRWQDGRAVAEASAHSTAAGIVVELDQHQPSERELPLALLNKAVRSGRLVRAGARFEGAGAAEPGDYPYLAAHPDCAALCIPLLKQSRLLGVLYLENRLSPDAFTAEHLQVLQLLAGQAAVSLETARLYAELMAENEQRRRIESELRQSQETLLMGEQISHSGSWTWDTASGLLQCSAEFCRIFGLDPARRRIPFASVMACIHPDDRARVEESALRAVRDRATIRSEYRAVRPDGEVRYLSGVGKPLPDEDTLYVGTVSDITARRQAEDTLRSAQADLARVARVTTVGQLTASIAHEVNQPLMSIASNAGASLRWLERDPPQLDKVREGMQDIVVQSKRAGQMIRSLQQLTRKAPPAHEVLDLHETIRHILAISRGELERQGVALELALDAPDSMVVGDGVQLQQLLLNLVVNAIDAMNESPGAQRTLAISSRAGAGREIEVRVEDSGTGLSPQVADQLFEAFYTTKANGMGMGLAICRSVVEAHHGRIHAAPRAPCGSSFVFILPTCAA
ncbi:AAA family ATPase [Oxalobacteraceae bacterium A2-2]